MPADVVLLEPIPVQRGLREKEGFLFILCSALLLAIGILKGVNLVVVLGYALVVLWLINAIVAVRGTRGVSARRVAPPPLVAGVAAEWEIDVHAVAGTSSTCTVIERVGDRRATWVIRRDKHAPTGHTLRNRVVFPTRGPIRIDPLQVRCGEPFGLVGRTAILLPAVDTVVLPKPARVDGERLRHWLFIAWAGRDDERQKVRRIVEREAEVHGLRDYRVGDSMRRIHWKASARRNKLIVREYDDSAPPRLLLVLDPWLPATPTNADLRRLEEAISLAAGVVRDWRRQAGARLALVIGGPTPTSLDGPAGVGLTERQWKQLALVGGGETSGPALPLQGLSRLARAAPALLLSSRQESPLLGEVERFLGRRVAFAHVGKPEMWFQLA